MSFSKIDKKFCGTSEWLASILYIFTYKWIDNKWWKWGKRMGKQSKGMKRKFADKQESETENFGKSLKNCYKVKVLLKREEEARNPKNSLMTIKLKWDNGRQFEFVEHTKWPTENISMTSSGERFNCPRFAVIWSRCHVKANITLHKGWICHKIIILTS